MPETLEKWADLERYSFSQVIPSFDYKLYFFLLYKYKMSTVKGFKKKIRVNLGMLNENTTFKKFKEKYMTKNRNFYKLFAYLFYQERSSILGSFVPLQNSVLRIERDENQFANLF